MAPMEPAKAPFAPPPRTGPSREELESALADTKLDDLKEMARRLSKSHESMNSMLEDLDEERKDLQVEKAEIEQTIDRFMKELQKLNIGADNTVEPQLLEDPLNVVNRLWEKFKPRDSGVVVSEHVGEIKKPNPDDDQSPQHREKVRQVVENVQSAVGPLWQRGLGAWGALRQKIDERNEPPPAPKKQPRKKKEPVASEGEGREAPAAPPQVAASSSSTASSTAAAAPAAAPEPAAPAPAPAPEAAAASAPAAAAAAEAEAAKEEEAAQEQISSTVLIEAELTLDDGSVQLLQVRAADRCKEVAKKFIQEHSLKAWFTEPLTKWLKQAEADAVKFPVKISGDLMEIRKQHGKS